MVARNAALAAACAAAALAACSFILTGSDSHSDGYTLARDTPSRWPTSAPHGADGGTCGADGGTIVFDCGSVVDAPRCDVFYNNGPMAAWLALRRGNRSTMCCPAGTQCNHPSAAGVTLQREWFVHSYSKVKVRYPSGGHVVATLVRDTLETDKELPPVKASPIAAPLTAQGFTLNYNASYCVPPRLASNYSGATCSTGQECVNRSFSRLPYPACFHQPWSPDCNASCPLCTMACTSCANCPTSEHATCTVQGDTSVATCGCTDGFIGRECEHDARQLHWCGPKRNPIRGRLLSLPSLNNMAADVKLCDAGRPNCHSCGGSTFAS